jgi:DNA-binding NtrC family response regulator
MPACEKKCVSSPLPRGLAPAFLARELRLASHAHQLENSVESPGNTIMIADRNANIRELLRREFGREGYAVDTAGSGAEVLTRLDRGGPVDVLVLDVEIASPDGKPLAPLLARRYPDLPLVLHVFPGLEPGEGGVAWVEKRGEFERLRDVVRQVLDGRNRLGRRQSGQSGPDAG